MSWKIVMSGHLDVGLVDSANKLYTAHLHVGDVFVFPQGLVHFRINMSKKQPPRALSAFGRSNAGTISLPKNIFGSGIKDEVLLKAFKIACAELMKLQAPFKPSK
ncbi:hypothetical protein Mapa_002485 [Marchantia paleacea]|nr:hypothetical protein Mapa_002485 [Marchantia paleacea]